MNKFLHNKFEDIVSIDNLLLAWQEFIKGKRNKTDVQKFSFNLMDNIFSLYHDLKNYRYVHSGYQKFNVNDPKPRIIHKAVVRDRLLHRAVYRILYPYFDKKFIADSFSCRNAKGLHKALDRFKRFIYVVSKNNTESCYVLKCDIRKFFASIDQDILIKILKKYIKDKDIVNLLKKIVFSFEKGLPLGNLTSQLFANVYLNEFDQFVKQNLKVKYYIRYADDFVFFSRDKICLKKLLLEANAFLQKNLKLQIHPNKIFIKSIYTGLDFLGWINFENHRVLRSVTKRRILKRLNEANFQSYLGLLKHGNTTKIKSFLLNKSQHLIY